MEYGFELMEALKKGKYAEELKKLQEADYQYIMEFLQNMRNKASIIPTFIPELSLLEMMSWDNEMQSYLKQKRVDIFVKLNEQQCQDMLNLLEDISRVYLNWWHDIGDLKKTLRDVLINKNFQSITR